MPKSTTTSNDIVNAICRGIDPSWRSGANRFIALHTSDPDDGGTQTTFEANYTNYARVQVTASTGFAEAVSGACSNANLIQFPQSGGVENILTYFSIGTSLTGAGQILVRGALSASLTVNNLIQPQFAPGSLTTTEI